MLFKQTAGSRFFFKVHDLTSCGKLARIQYSFPCVKRASVLGACLWLHCLPFHPFPLTGLPCLASTEDAPSPTATWYAKAGYIHGRAPLFREGKEGWIEGGEVKGRNWEGKLRDVKYINNLKKKEGLGSIRQLLVTTSTWMALPKFTDIFTDILTCLSLS